MLNAVLDDYGIDAMKAKKAKIQAEEQKKNASAVLDDAYIEAQDDMESAELSVLRLEVAALFSAWSEVSSDDLDKNETLSERFEAMMVGLADQDKDGDITEDEADLLFLAYSLAAEYLADKGVDTGDIADFLNDGNESAAQNIQELLIGSAPDGEDAELDEIHRFAFDGDSDEAVLDSAVYKKQVAVRAGKRVIIRKRVAGFVKLSPKQKMAIKKMQRKAHSGAARMKRMKSMKIRQRLGLNK